MANTGALISQTVVFNIIRKSKNRHLCYSVQFYFYVTKRCIHFIILLELLKDIKSKGCPSVGRIMKKQQLRSSRRSSSSKGDRTPHSLQNRSPLPRHTCGPSHCTPAGPGFSTLVLVVNKQINHVRVLGSMQRLNCALISRHPKYE